jgi:type IV pilus assembly protein PilY1
MNHHFKPNAATMAICIAFSAAASNALAQEPYPALPPSLSTSVTPNVLLFIDNSGSMELRPDGSGSTGPNDPTNRMMIAKSVAKQVIDDNTKCDPVLGVVPGPCLRFGLFTFDTASSSTSGRLVRPIADMNATNRTTLKTEIDALYPLTNSPLGETMVEITRYFEGKTSLYSKLSPATATYTSPIQYRCQKNFVVVLTDGDGTADEELPGTGAVGVQLPLPYTARKSNGDAVAKNFSVCTASNALADDGQNVTCPTKLEGDTNNRVFRAAGLNQPAGIRDVAKYGQVADLRVGGNDLDGKSFDDPKYARQNLATYTVAFGTVDNKELPAAATAGGGKYFKAADQAALISSLANAIADIRASTSNAGGFATLSEYTAAGNKIFQPVFNPNGWYGELRCYELLSTGIGSACTPSAKEVIPAEASRKIFSAKVVGTTTTPFTFDHSTGWAAMTDAQKIALAITPEQLTATVPEVPGPPVVPAHAPTAAEIDARKATALAAANDQKNTIKFVRGVEGITGFRTRPLVNSVKTFMGDIVDGQPVVVSAPGGFTNATDYATFKTNNSSRGMVLVGANAGMLHAFSISNMTELAAYVPSAVYPRLRALTAADYGTSGGTAHTYHVNGSIGRPMDFKTSAAGPWKTMVVGGLGQGGQGHYALDVTNAASFDAATSLVKWEWTDASDNSIGYSMGTPIMSTVRKSATESVPAVIFSNGYLNSHDDTVSGGQKTTGNTSALFIVNADTGVLIKKLELPTTGTYKSEGLSSPWGVDVAQDGILDYVYAGDVNGQLWRFDLTADTAADFKVSTNSSNVPVPLFKAPAGQPITMRPATLGVKNVGNMVLFGTGQLLTDADRTTTTTQAFYGILDKMQSNIETISIANNASDLVQQSVLEEYTMSGGSNKQGTFRKVSANEIDVTDVTSNTKKGWYMNLPTSSERLVATPRIYANVIQFPTGVPISADQCTAGGTGWIMALNPLTGSIVSKGNAKPSANKDYSYFDMNGDKRSTTADKVAFTVINGGPAYASGVKDSDGIPTELSFVATGEGLTNFPSLGSEDPYAGSGGFVAMLEANAQGVGAGQAGIGGGRRGETIQRRQLKGGGILSSGSFGSDGSSETETNPEPTDGVRIEASTWRELKN